MDVLAKALISGMVQGVGFRYFVTKVANQFGLDGTVKNLADGRVYIEVEGDKNIIQAFLKEVRVGNRWADVQTIDVDWEDYQGKFKGFHVAF